MFQLDFDDSMLEENMRYLLGVVLEHRLTISKRITENWIGKLVDCFYCLIIRLSMVCIR